MGCSAKCQRTEIAFKPRRSIVSPLEMLALPAHGWCPPERIAKGHWKFVDSLVFVKILTISATSATFSGAIIAWRSESVLWMIMLEGNRNPSYRKASVVLPVRTSMNREIPCIHCCRAPELLMLSGCCGELSMLFQSSWKDPVDSHVSL